MSTVSRLPRRLALTSCVIITLSLAGASILFLRVNELYCFVQYANCSPEIVAALQPLKGQRLLLADNGAQIQQLLQSNPDIRLQEVSKQLPATLTIRLEPQKIAYALKNPASDRHVAFTVDGRLLVSDLRPDWPTFITTNELLDQIQSQNQISVQLHQQLVGALTAIKELGWANPSVYLIDEQTISLQAENKPALILPLEGITTQFDRAQELVDNLPTETIAKTQEIDLRFKLPVLRETPTIPRHDSL